MRKAIIFGAIATLFGLVAVAQAGDDLAEQTMRNGGQMTRAESDARGEAAEHKYRERAEYRERDDDDARKHGKEAREGEHRSGAHVDRD